MIRKLRIKFTVLAMSAVCILLVLVVAGMNIINYSTVVAEADVTLELLSRNRGSFPEMKNDRFPPLPRPMSPELPYESRYFSVVLDAKGNVILTDTGKIASVDSGAAADYARKAYAGGKTGGFIGDFRYLRGEENGNTRMVFLDCGRKLGSFRSFLYASLGMTLAGLVAVFFIILFFGERIVRPIAQSYEKQKRFITDAGHELKTPLTIISANADILEMELGEESESLADIRQQTQRLTKLTNDLVLLARMEEAGSRLQMIEFPLSEIITEAVQPFCTLAQTQGKALSCRILPTLTLRGNARAMEQMVSVLMDNALKYTPAGGRIVFSLEQSGKSAVLTVRNTTDRALSAADLTHLFDRFYRADTSRNSETGGHGIGLSVAQAIVAAHGGKLRAACEGTDGFVITATFPL